MSLKILKKFLGHKKSGDFSVYEVVFDPKVIEFLEKSEKNLAKRIWSKIMSTKENPHHFFERLSGRSDYKLRIGDYRAIADIDDNKKKIELTFVGHRKNVYQTFLIRSV